MAIACGIALVVCLLLVACGATDQQPTPQPTPAPAATLVAVAASPTQGAATATGATSPMPTNEPSPDPTGTTGVASPTAAVTTPQGATPVGDIDLPDTPVGQRFGWIFKEINADTNTLTPDVVPANFAPVFLEQLPATQASLAIRSFAVSYGPFVFEGFVAPPTPTEAQAILVASTGEHFLMTLVVEAEPPHLVTGLLFEPAPEPVQMANWEEIDAHLAALAPESSFLVADVSNASCQPLYGLNTNAQLAIGSTFKLYVLGELARQIEAGERSWDDELAIEERWRSLPSGVMQDEPTEATFTLREYATQMISISDNTATDHLILLLGRQQVEDIQGTMGHGTPERNVPFLTTREMFALKLVMPAEERDAFLAATVEEQRELLSSRVADAELSTADANTWTSPRMVEELEWFASLDDLCAAMLWLDEAAERPGLEPLRDILSRNPGIPLDTGTWTWVGFKGGSEPGVLNLSWLLERADGRQFFVSASFNNTHQVLDNVAAIELLMGVVAFLETEAGAP
jgi:beta-lactamase class A